MSTEKQVIDTFTPVIHVLVALCDNKYQGIVPVPARIGNGQDPGSNLYWGCGFGVKTYFKNSKEWQLVYSRKIDSVKLERCVFYNGKTGFYLVADAYNGKYIRNCIMDFFRSCAGRIKDTVGIKGKTVGINGNAGLIAYIGHDGLMDFKISGDFTSIDGKERNAIILACISKHYFASCLLPTKAKPVLWSTGLMSPEAYTLHDALNEYMNRKDAEEIRASAARAYALHQHCGEKAAKKLLVTGY